MKHSMVVAVLAVLAVGSGSAVAQATYTYTGNSFNIFSCDDSGNSCSTPAPVNLFTSYLAGDHATASLTLDAPLGPNFEGDAATLPGFSLVMSDGQQILTSLDSDSFAAFVATDDAGAIVAWNVYLDSGNASGSSIMTYSYFSLDIDVATLLNTDFEYDAAGNQLLRGTWTLSVPPPPPPSPQDLTRDLIATVAAMQIKLGNSLTSQLQAVLTDIVQANGQACRDLNAFTNHVRAQTGKKISLDQANTIGAAVRDLKLALGCQ